MAARKKINNGDKFGKLTILREIDAHITPCGTKQRIFECKCDCGKIVNRRIISLNDKSSCNNSFCSYKTEEKINSKEIRKSFLYTTWKGMKQRCYDNKSNRYSRYGGRGIKICEEWMIYKNFYNWAIENGASKSLTIDRINLDSDYCPSNCRFVDSKTQANNKSVNRKITYVGETLNICQWADKLGINEAVIRSRIDKYGYTIGQALGFEERITIMPKRPHCRKRILQLDVDGVFIREWKSLNEIEDELRINIKTIMKCCEGRQLTAKWYKWKWANSDCKKQKYNISRKKVFQYDDNWNLLCEYTSSLDASTKLQCDNSRIVKICSKNSNSKCRNFHWSYNKK